MFFDNASKPSIVSIDYEKENGGYSCAKEIMFDKNGHPSSVFDNYKFDLNMNISWARSFHFYPDGTTARLEGCEQPFGLNKIYFDKAIYPQYVGRYVVDTNGTCQVDESGYLKF